MKKKKPDSRSMQSFTDLEAWKCAMELVAEIYELTKAFPRDERFGLTDQLQRASKGILLNIAEGFGRFTYPDKASKYIVARGESTEVEAGLLIAIRLRFVTQDRAAHALQLVRRTGRLLSGLISACRRRE